MRVESIESMFNAVKSSVSIHKIEDHRRGARGVQDVQETKWCKKCMRYIKNMLRLNF